MKKLDKAELIEEINDLLDSLSPADSTKILNKLNVRDLVTLKHAVEQALREAEQKRAEEETTHERS